MRSPMATIEERFLDFHAANPWVYDELVLLARRAKRRGLKKIGIDVLFGNLRWRQAIRTSGDQGFKMNNDFRSRYPRLIMDQEPDLEGFFEVRALKAR
jgi:hypothetical protein